MIVVSDATPLIVLAKVGQFQLLKEIFGEIYISEAVFKDVVEKGKGRAGAREIEISKWMKHRKVKNKKQVNSIAHTYGLGLGESETIVLSEELVAEFTLIDERRARLVAQLYGCNVLGSLGILERAYEKGLLKDLEATYRRLRETDVYLSDKLVEASLKKFGLI